MAFDRPCSPNSTRADAVKALALKLVETIQELCGEHGGMSLAEVVLAMHVAAKSLQDGAEKREEKKPEMAS